MATNTQLFAVVDAEIEEIRMKGTDVTEVRRALNVLRTQVTGDPLVTNVYGPLTRGSADPPKRTK